MNESDDQNECSDDEIDSSYSEFVLEEIHDD